MRKFYIVILIMNLFSFAFKKHTIDKAEIYNVIPGLENVQDSKTLMFKIITKEPIILDSNLVETTTSDIFKIKIASIFNIDNMLQDYTSVLNPGTYRIVAKNINNDFVLKDNLIFNLKINDQFVQIKPVLKDDLLMQ